MLPFEKPALKKNTEIKRSHLNRENNQTFQRIVEVVTVRKNDTDHSHGLAKSKPKMHDQT